MAASQEEQLLLDKKNAFDHELFALRRNIKIQVIEYVTEQIKKYKLNTNGMALECYLSAPGIWIRIDGLLGILTGEQIVANHDRFRLMPIYQDGKFMSVNVHDALLSMLKTAKVDTAGSWATFVAVTEKTE